MPKPPPDDATLQEVADAWRAHRSEVKAAASLGMSRSGYRVKLASIAKRGLDEEILGGIPAAHAVKAASTLRGPDGEIKLQWVKSSPDLSPDDLLELTKGAFDGLKPTRPTRQPKTLDADLLTVYPFADWHLGLYAWGEEAGHDWDLTIAEDKIGSAVERVIAQSPQADEAEIVFLGDLLHADNSENRTLRSGNVLDVDTRYGKVIDTTIKLSTRSIDLALHKHGKVRVRYLPGNHDDHSALVIAKAVEAWYRLEDRVEVDTSPSRFWFRLFGATFLGATHGDQCKMRDLPAVMAARQPQMWGASKFRYGYAGHIHRREKTTDTIMGVTCETFETPVAMDAYSAGHGYLTNRSVQSITIHRDMGEESRRRVAVI